MNPKLKKIIIISSAVVAILIIWGAIDIINKIGKIEVIIAASPSDSQITMDDNKINTGKSYIKKGSHVFTAKRSGFNDCSIMIDITDNFKDSVILLLDPNSDEGRAFLNNNPNEQLTREGLGGILANQDGQNTTNKTPLIKILPFIDLDYRVDYGASLKTPKDNTSVAIYITSISEASKQDALNWIKDSGYDVNNLEIVYKYFNTN